MNWIANALTSMHPNGLSAMEPKVKAADAWMETVGALAQRTLLSKVQTWYVGANVEGKPKGLTIFTGGFPKYAEYCAAAAKAGKLPDGDFVASIRVRSR